MSGEFQSIQENGHIVKQERKNAADMAAKRSKILPDANATVSDTLPHPSGREVMIHDGRVIGWDW